MRRVPDWWLDELAHAGAEHLDEAYVAGYERKSGYDPEPDLDVLARFGLGPRSSVLDVGAGVGVFAAARALSYEHAGEPVDVVFSRNVLHQLPDLWKGIAPARIADAMKPGGIFRLHDLVYDFEPAEAATAIPAWLAGAVADPRDGWTADELAEHVRIEFSTYSWLFEPMLERCGFEILEREYRRGAYGAYVCRRR